MKRKDFQGLAALRLKEARILFENGCWEGAYYLGGYAVECALKACIAKQTERHEFPDKKRVNDSHTHDIKELSRVARLEDAIEQAAKINPKLSANWTIVRNWSERSRYARPSQVQAEELFGALTAPKDGVFRWLKQHW